MTDHSDRETIAHVEADAPENPATVEQVFQVVRATFDDERSRSQGLEAKSSTLAGFSGAILALTLTQIRAGPPFGVGIATQRAMNLLFLVSVVLLATSSLLYLAVLRPRSHTVLDVVTEEMLTATKLSAPPTEVQGRMATTLAGMIATARAANDRKARTMEQAGRVLTAGLLVAGAQGVIVALDRI